MGQSHCDVHGDYIYGKALEMTAGCLNRRSTEFWLKLWCKCPSVRWNKFETFNTGQSVRNYLLRIRRKTALLIAVSCQLGALATRAPDHISSLLYTYGYNVGMAFQIQDDVLDLVGTEKQLGKPQAVI